MATTFECWFFKNYVTVNLLLKNLRQSRAYITQQLEKHRADRAYTEILIDTGCVILSDNWPEGARELAASMMDACGDDRLLKQKIIVAGNSYFLEMMHAKRWSSELSSLLAHLIKSCGDDMDLKQPLLNTVKTAIIANNDVVPHEMRILIKKTFEACGTDIQAQQQIIGASLDRVPSIAKSAVYEAQSLIESLLATVGKDKDALIKPLVGKLGNGQILVVSRGGSENRTNYALVTPGEDRTYETDFIVGCFRGTAKELVAASGKSHGVGTEHNLYYKSFAAAARQAGKYPETVLPMRETFVTPPVVEKVFQI